MKTNTPTPRVETARISLPLTMVTWTRNDKNLVSPDKVRRDTIRGVAQMFTNMWAQSHQGSKRFFNKNAQDCLDDVNRLTMTLFIIVCFFLLSTCCGSLAYFTMPDRWVEISNWQMLEMAMSAVTFACGVLLSVAALPNRYQGINHVIVGRKWRKVRAAALELGLVDEYIRTIKAGDRRGYSHYSDGGILLFSIEGELTEVVDRLMTEAAVEVLKAECDGVVFKKWTQKRRMGRIRKLVGQLSSTTVPNLSQYFANAKAQLRHY